MKCFWGFVVCLCSGFALGAPLLDEVASLPQPEFREELRTTSFEFVYDHWHSAPLATRILPEIQELFSLNGKAVFALTLETRCEQRSALNRSVYLVFTDFTMAQRALEEFFTLTNYQMEAYRLGTEALFKPMRMRLETASGSFVQFFQWKAGRRWIFRENEKGLFSIEVVTLHDYLVYPTSVQPSSRIDEAKGYSFSSIDCSAEESHPRFDAWCD